MAEQYRFFGSAAGDERQYNQTEFAEVLKRIFRNGYFPGVGNNLVVTANDPATMSVLVTTGEAWIEGYWYKNDTNKVLNINPADSVLNRIDRVVLRLDVVTGRAINVVIKQGTVASNPSPPALTRTAQTYEISLAQIYVNAGITSISQALIFDERENTNVCGQALSYYVGQECIKDLNVNNKKIVNVASPTGNNDAANKKYVDDGLNTKVNTTDVSTTAAPNKLLKLNAQSKLPASITGDADTVDDKHATGTLNTNNKTNLVAAINEAYQVHAYGSVTYNEDIAANTTIQKTISIPSGKRYGQLTVSGIGSGSGSFIVFDKEIINAKTISPVSAYGYRKYNYNVQGSSLGSNTFLEMNSLRIDGNYIRFNFKNNSTTDIGQIRCIVDWEVW